jgi:hypothetical protein
MGFSGGKFHSRRPSLTLGVRKCLGFAPLRNPESQRGSKEAEAAEACALVLQVLKSVINPDLMSFEKVVNLIAGFKAEQTAEIRLGETSLSIFIGNERFEDTA